MKKIESQLLNNANGRRQFLKNGVSLFGAAAVSALVSSKAAAAGRIDARLEELGIVLAETPAPVANYVAYQVANGFAYIAGQVPFKEGELLHPGTVPVEVSIADANLAARQCGLNILSALKSACEGDLDRVIKCMRLQGFVASSDDFTQQPTVVNGASDLMVEVFGDAGRHTRLAVGVNTLPLNSCVEVSGVFAIR